MNRIVWFRNLYDATPIKQTVFERDRGRQPIGFSAIAGIGYSQGIALLWGECNRVYEYIFHLMFINITVAWTWRTELIIYVGKMVLLYDVLSFNECQRGSKCER